MQPAIRIKMLHPGARVPTRATSGSGAFDLYAPEPGVLAAGERRLIPLGIAYEISDDIDMQLWEDSGPGKSGGGVSEEDLRVVSMKFHGLLISRSGLAAQGIRLYMGTGLIDNDYRGELKVLLVNDSDVAFEWCVGDRLCQLAFVPMYAGKAGLMFDYEQLTPTQRGEGGFGSTGA